MKKNLFKKSMSVLLSVLMLMSCWVWVAPTEAEAVSGTVYGPPEGNAKLEGHTYSKVVTAPTCIEDGYTTYTCACGDSYTADEVPATGHNMTLSEVVAPTCEEDGYTVYICANGCGTTENRDVTAKKGHDYASEITLEPTCISQGIITFTCKNDGSHIHMAAIPALGHKDNNKDGYCDACGTFTCKHTETVTLNENPATCEFDGYSGDTVCARCGLEFSKGVFVPAEGHSFGTTPVGVIPATCTKPAGEVYKCKKCSETETIYDVAGDVVPHTIVIAEYIEPTCDKPGYIHYVCLLCDASIRTEEISAKGHKDENNDGKCDDPDCSTNKTPDSSSECSCLCHNENAIMQFIYKIVKFFWKLFGMNRSCDCGNVHY